MSSLRAKRLATTLEGLHSEAKGFKLREKGIITPEGRELFCEMSAAGCSVRNIGRLANRVLKILAPKSKAASEKEVSAHTVGRAIGEGGIAAEIQLGYELMHAKSKC